MDFLKVVGTEQFINLLIVKFTLNFIIVTIATLCYRISVGIPLSPIRKFLAVVTIASVVAFFIIESLPPLYYTKIYVFSFFIGLLSDTTVSVVTATKLQKWIINTLAKTITKNNVDIINMDDEENVDREKTEKEPEVKNDDDVDTKIIKRKRRTTKR